MNAITDYEDSGPFTVQATSMGQIDFWVPAVPSGCKVPVVHLANGTGACADYAPFLQRMATQGFLATCFQDAHTGAGNDGIAAFQAALAMFPNLADKKLGSVGHGEGGQGALVTLQLAEAMWGSAMVYAGFAMSPESGLGSQPDAGTWQQVYAEIKSPIFMLAGAGMSGNPNGDGIVSEAWVNQGYEATSPSEEAYLWTANGATYSPPPDQLGEDVAVPWFRWELLGDAKACAFFKAMPASDPTWTQVESKNEQPCP
jgi:hypothetical protein